MPRLYEEKIEKSDKVCGKVLLTKQFRTPPPLRNKVWVKYNTLSNNNHLVRICKGIIAFILQICTGAGSRYYLKRSRQLLPNIDSVHLNDEVLSAAEQRSDYSEWKWLISFARLVLSGRGVDPFSGGKTEGFSLLFRAENAFERFVIKALSSGLADSKLQFASSRSIGFLLRDEDGRKNHLLLKPDVVLRHGEDTFVCDVKWKIFGSPGVPERSDVFQMLTYLSQVGSNIGIFLYPAFEPINDCCRVKRLQAENQNVQIAAVEVDLNCLLEPDTDKRADSERRLAAIVADLVLSMKPRLLK